MTTKFGTDFGLNAREGIYCFGSVCGRDRLVNGNKKVLMPVRAFIVLDEDSGLAFFQCVDVLMPVRAFIVLD